MIATAAAAVIRSGTCSGMSSRVSGGFSTKPIASRVESLTQSCGRTRCEVRAHLVDGLRDASASGTPSSAAIGAPSAM